MPKLSEFNFEKKEKTVNEEDVRGQFEKYKDMSKQELNYQLLSEVARQKSQGTFDYDKLSQMVEGLKGSLPEQDYNNIKRILESLR